MTDWRPGHALILETDLYVLRSMKEDDVDDKYVSWWNDPEVQLGFNRRPRKWGIEEARKQVTGFNNETSFHLLVFPKETGKKVGFFSFYHDPKHNTGTTYFCLGDKTWWGKDVFVEIKPKVLDFMFDTLGVDKVESQTKGRNVASMYTNKALGIPFEGILRKHGISPLGKRIDIFLFGITKPEWHAKRGYRK